MNKNNGLIDKLIVLSLCFLSQACCVMGTSVSYDKSWVATSNPKPTLSSEDQIKSCIAEDIKQCSEDYALTCDDVLSANNNTEILNRSTGKPLTPLRITYLKTACEKLKNNPNNISECQHYAPVDSCMLKNGYQLQETNPVRECKSMQFL